jgi:hypothetical protein
MLCAEQILARRCSSGDGEVHLSCLSVPRLHPRAATQHDTYDADFSVLAVVPMQAIRCWLHVDLKPINPPPVSCVHVYMESECESIHTNRRRPCTRSDPRRRALWTATPSPAQSDTSRSSDRTVPTLSRCRLLNRYTYIAHILALIAQVPALPRCPEPNGTPRSYLERLDGEYGECAVRTAHRSCPGVVPVGAEHECGTRAVAT